MGDFLTWQVGDVKITRIQESEESGLEWVLKDAVPENLKTIPWLAPHFVDAEWEAAWSIHALVLELGSRRIIVDTCVGNDKNLPVKFWNKLQTSFLDDFHRAGFTRDSIDTVLCTHLHVDHVGWNTCLEDGVWRPTFPNARYIVHEAEWKAALEPDPRSAAAYRGEDFLPLEKEGLLELVGDSRDLGDGVSVVRTGGHTGGHLMVVVESGGETAVYPADLIPSRYHVRLPYVAGIDLFPLEVIEEKKKLLERAEQENWLLILDHDVLGNVGRVTKDHRGRFVFKDV